MNYKKIEEQNYDLHMIKTNKFRTTTITINFSNHIDDVDINQERILLQLLNRSSKKYNSFRKLVEKRTELYIKGISTFHKRLANLIFTSIELEFYDEEFVKEDNLVECLDLIKELILNPNQKNGLFIQEEFDYIKTVTIEENNNYYAEPENKAFLSFQKLIGKDNPIGIDLRGDNDLLEKITNEEVSNYYHKFIKESDVDIIFLSSNVSKKTENIIREVFKDNPFKKKKLSFSQLSHQIKEYQEYADSGDNIQNISIFGSVNNELNTEERIATSLYYGILAGGSSSRLFNILREKHSLVYTVRLTRNSFDNMTSVLFLYDAKNKEKLFKIVKEVCESMSDISEEELSIAKESWISKIKSFKDNPSYLILSAIYSKQLNDLSFDEQIQIVKKIKLEEVKAIHSKVIRALTYTLGAKNEN